MEEASVEEEHPTGARKLRSPARVDKALESASRIGAHYESAVSGVAQVEEDTNGGFEVRRARVGHETSELRGGLLNYIFSVDKGIFKQIDSPSPFGDVGQLTIDVPKFQQIVQQLKHSGVFKDGGILTKQDETMLDALVEYSAVINNRGADAGSALAGAQIIGEMFTIDPHKFISGLARLGSQARIAQLFANDQFVKAVTGTGKPMSTAEKLRTMFAGKGAFGSVIADVAMEQMGIRESDAEQTDRMLQDSGGDAVGSIYGNL